MISPDILTKNHVIKVSCRNKLPFQISVVPAGKTVGIKAFPLHAPRPGVDSHIFLELDATKLAESFDGIQIFSDLNRINREFVEYVD